ncbi:MAG: UDP-N-acetylglucosamine 2-epimerase (non-hydrolyzing) [Methanosarcinales archaeon]|nr:UDP-N-acetylglucosamine 2-epimerase (non-hydrolyzing) [Methanosarcinales archaeon]
MKDKIASIVGARPNFIKCAPLSREIRKEFNEVIIHTGQHYDYEMNKVFFEELNIPEPDYHLDVGSGSHGYQTGEMIKRIEEVLLKEEPDLVLVYGDTNSTIAGALAASKLHITVAHIESGLRSYDKSMPEEINRILTDHCSDILFCPTETSADNLKREGVMNGVHLTGDVMVDALKENIKIAEKKERILDEIDLKSKEYYLATIHRAENTDDFERLENIVDAFCEIGNLVFPCHPRTEKSLKGFGLWDRLVENTRVIRPVGYLDMLMLEKNARKVLTDSGGVQKEAYIFKVPCITLRDNTEWVETVEDGWNVLVGADEWKIVREANEFKPGNKQRNVFGSGDASERIAKIVRELR